MPLTGSAKAPFLEMGVPQDRIHLWAEFQFGGPGPPAGRRLVEVRDQGKRTVGIAGSDGIGDEFFQAIGELDEESDAVSRCSVKKRDGLAVSLSLVDGGQRPLHVARAAFVCDRGGEELEHEGSVQEKSPT